MDPKRQAVIEVLAGACRLLARPSNDFPWSSLEDANAAPAELKTLIGWLQTGPVLNRVDVEVLFASTRSHQRGKPKQRVGARISTAR